MKKYKVLKDTRRLSDDRLFGEGEIIELDPKTTNIDGLMAGGHIAAYDGSDKEADMPEPVGLEKPKDK